MEFKDFCKCFDKESLILMCVAGTCFVAVGIINLFI